MGWAAHNIEAWEELEDNAIVRWLTGLWKEHHTDVENLTDGMLLNLVQALYTETAVRTAMLDAGAWREIDESEYFDRLDSMVIR